MIRGGSMPDNSDISALPVSGDPAGAATPAEPAAPTGQADPADPANAGRAADGEGPGDEHKPPRGNPWDTFRFKRFGGLEKRAPEPEPPAAEQDTGE
jgi:hypothetical protein